MKTKTPRQINAERKKAGLPPLNFKLFRKVIKKLEAAPDAYRQSIVMKRHVQAPCGTAACIGGWAYLLNGGRFTQTRLEKPLGAAATALGLSRRGTDWDDNVDSRTLFASYPEDSWPNPYASQWANTTTVRQQARVAIRYLTHIMKTGNVTE